MFLAERKKYMSKKPQTLINKIIDLLAAQQGFCHSGN